MKRVLITGGTGFVGANLAERLLQDGHEVHLLVRPSYEAWRIEAHKNSLRVHVLDTLDRSALKTCLCEVKPQWIFHLAAHGAYSWETDLTNILSTNVQMSTDLLQSALEVGFEAFINAGSSSEYGLKQQPPRESEALDPNSHYAVSKAYFSMLCRYTAVSQKKRIITLRLYSVYGPYEHPKRFVPTLLLKTLQGALPPLVNPDTARDFVYAPDVCDAFVRAATVDDLPLGAIYNIGSSVQTTIRDAVESAVELMQIDAKPDWGAYPQRIWDTNSWVSNIDAARNELKWEPKTNFAQGFAAFRDWMLADPQRRSFYEHHTNK